MQRHDHVCSIDTTLSSVHTEVQTVPLSPSQMHGRLLQHSLGSGFWLFLTTTASSTSRHLPCSWLTCLLQVQQTHKPGALNSAYLLGGDLLLPHGCHCSDPLRAYGAASGTHALQEVLSRGCSLSSRLSDGCSTRLEGHHHGNVCSKKGTEAF
jgi:hypothetical protein